MRHILILTLIFVIGILTACTRDHDSRYYQITFDTDGGGAIQTMRRLEEGDTITLPIPKKEGYLFTGWYDENTLYYDASVVVSSLALKARFEAIEDVLIYSVDDKGVRILQYRGDGKYVALPETIEAQYVVRISSRAFQDVNLEHLRLPRTVTHVDSEAFLDASLLETVAFYGQYKGYYFMTHFDSEKYYALLDENEEVCIKHDDPEHPTDESRWVFSEGCPIHKVTGQSEPIYYSGNWIYAYEVVFDLAYYSPHSQPLFGLQVFAGTSIKTFEIPARTRTLHPSVFHDAQALESITVDEDNPFFQAVDGVLYSIDRTQILVYPQGKADTIFEIPLSVTTITGDVFFGDTALETVYIHKFVDTIDDYPFMHLLSLQAIEVDEENPSFRSIDGVLFDKGARTILMYPANKEGQAYTLDDGVTQISAFAFFNARNLETLSLPNALTHVGYGAFAFALKLEVLEFPKSVIEIDVQLFATMDALEKVVFHRGISEPSLTVYAGAPFLYWGPITLYVPDDSLEAYRALYSESFSPIEPISARKD